MVNNKRIVLWCGGAPNQKALAARIAQQFSLAGIVIDERKTVSKRKVRNIPSLVWDRIRFKNIYDSWKKLQEYYGQKYPSWPGVPILRVPEINDDQAAAFTTELKPDLIAVSGTALVKKKLLDIPASIGIINLHTGLSPYVKGGPNCTNWCIANNEWHLIGNTIMWLNAGIDSGNIITSECIDIRESQDLFDVQKKVIEHAHELYLRAINYLFNEQPPYITVPQSSLGKGNLYLTKMWTAAKRKALIKNWRNRRKVTTGHEKPVTIDLPSAFKNPVAIGRSR